MLGCDLIDIYVSNADKIIPLRSASFRRCLRPISPHTDGDVLHVMNPVGDLARDLRGGVQVASRRALLV
jgi:hypothetical protein